MAIGISEILTSQANAKLKLKQIRMIIFQSLNSLREELQKNIGIFQYYPIPTNHPIHWKENEKKVRVNENGLESPNLTRN